LDPADASVCSWLFNEPVVALSLTQTTGVLLVALGSRLILWELAGGRRIDFGVSLDGWPQVRFNEGRTGPDGHFWVGSMRNNVNADGSLRDSGGQDGVLLRIGSDGSSTLEANQLGITNTLCWTPDRRQLIFGDTLANTLYIAECDTGHLQNQRAFFAGFERGLPDGSAIDLEGYIWNCRFNGGCIVRISPAGQVDKVIEMPTRNPTTCVFGGTDFRTLYITSASVSTKSDDRLAGSVFALRTEIPGRHSFIFKG